MPEENPATGLQATVGDCYPVEASPACACGSMQPAVARTPPMKTSRGRAGGKSESGEQRKGRLSPGRFFSFLSLEKHSKRGFQGSKKAAYLVISVRDLLQSDNIACLMTALIGVPVGGEKCVDAVM